MEQNLLPIVNGLLPYSALLPAGLGLFAVCILLCLDVLKSGLLQILRLAPNEDTLALFATLFTLADGVTQLVLRLRPETMPFFAPCALVLTFHLIGLRSLQSARFQSSRMAASTAQPYLVTQDPNVLNGKSAFRKWLGPPRGFGSQIRTQSEVEYRFQRLTPVLLVACVVLSLITTVAHHQPKLVFWSLSALFCAAATLSAPLALALPFRILAGKLAKLGAALAGWPGVLAARGGKATLLLDHDIYPPGSVTLVNSQAFSNLPIERVLGYTASVIRASGSGLAYLFDRLVRGRGANYLPIEKLTIQESGLIGQCQNQQILVGNSEFMTRMGIVLPAGIRAKDAIFCAVDREALGMFVLRYNLHPAILPALRALFAHKIHPILATRDFNLSPHRLRMGGRLPQEQVTIPDLQRRVQLSGPRQVHDTTLVSVLCREGAAPFTLSVVGALRLYRSARLNGLFARVSACIGVFLTATLSSAGSLSAMCAWNLSLFLLLWAVPVLMISLWTTQY